MNKVKVRSLPSPIKCWLSAYLTSFTPQKDAPMSSNNTLRSVPIRSSELHLLWQAWLIRLNSSVWPYLILIVLALGLLGAFHKVTSGIVQQSELRLQSISAYNKATGQCNGLSNRIARENCLAQRQVLVSEMSAQQP